MSIYFLRYYDLFDFTRTLSKMNKP